MRLICKCLIFAILVVFQAYAEEEEDYSGCNENQCPFGQVCIPQGKDSHYCRLSGVTIACISIACLFIVCLIPVATILLLYCLGIACNIECIQNFFERCHYKLRRRKSSEGSVEGPASNLNSRRKRRVKRYLENKEDEQHGSSKERIRLKLKTGVVRQPVFVRTAMSKSREQSQKTQQKAEPQSDFDFHQLVTRTPQIEKHIQVTPRETAIVLGEDPTQETPPNAEQQQTQNQSTEQQTSARALNIADQQFTTPSVPKSPLPAPKTPEKDAFAQSSDL